MIRDTSLLAFNEITATGLLGEREAIVYRAICQNPNKTDQELMQLLGQSDPNYVRPRRKELLDLELIEDAGTRECSVTGMTAHIWIAKKNPSIEELKAKKEAKKKKNTEPSYL